MNAACHKETHMFVIFGPDGARVDLGRSGVGQVAWGLARGCQGCTGPLAWAIFCSNIVLQVACINKLIGAMHFLSHVDVRTRFPIFWS